MLPIEPSRGEASPPRGGRAAAAAVACLLTLGGAGSLLGAEFQVNMLTNGAVGVGCIRCHSTTIVPYLEASS